MTEKQIEDLKKENAKLRDNLTKSEEKNNHLKTQMDKITSELKESNSKNSKLTAENEHLKIFEQAALENIDLHNKLSDIQSDIKTTVGVFIDVSQSLGIEKSIFSGGRPIMEVLPGLLGKITTQLMTGQVDGEKLASLSAIAPVMDKYRPLVEDIIPEGDESATK